MLDQACVCVRKKECRSTANKPNDQCVCPTRTNFNVQGCCSWFPGYDDLLLLFRHIKVNKAPASAVVSSVSCWVEAGLCSSGYSNHFGLDEQWQNFSCTVARTVFTVRMDVKFSELSWSNVFQRSWTSSLRSLCVGEGWARCIQSPVSLLIPHWCLNLMMLTGWCLFAQMQQWPWCYSGVVRKLLRCDPGRQGECERAARRKSEKPHCKV